MEKDRFHVQEQFALEMKDEAMWNCRHRAPVVAGAGMSTIQRSSMEATQVTDNVRLMINERSNPDFTPARMTDLLEYLSGLPTRRSPSLPTSH